MVEIHSIQDPETGFVWSTCDFGWTTSVEGYTVVHEIGWDKWIVVDLDRIADSWLDAMKLVAQAMLGELA